MATEPLHASEEEGEGHRGMRPTCTDPHVSVHVARSNAGKQDQQRDFRTEGRDQRFVRMQAHAMNSSE